MRRYRILLCAVSIGAAMCAPTGHAASLWRGEQALASSLFVDQKARQIGDILTVLISEQSTATRSATTTTGRTTSVDDKIEKWFTINGLWNLLRGRDSSAQPAAEGNLPAIKLSAKHNFQGGGTTLRNDTFTARVSCQVQEILPNNHLVIEGRQSVAVNAEEQIIVLRGVVRPQDVRPDNIVLSYNIADAQISYLGKGPIGDKQRRGFLQWLGDTVWPF